MSCYLVRRNASNNPTKEKEMKDFNVLLTCCAMHVKERIESLKDNEDGVKVGVVAVNSNKYNLPPHGMSDAEYVVPLIHDESYIPTLMQICRKHKIDIIIPTVTLELQLMADWKDYFEQNGIKVSVSSPQTISIANNKIELQKKYASLMPLQIIPKTADDVLSFKATLHSTTLCSKLSNHCGGNGFAIIDDEKALDPTLFNRYATDRYISTADLIKIVERGNEEVILQEYTEGYDYTVSVLAVNGEVTHAVGYVGYMMSYGSIMRGEIKYNQQAYAIATRLCKELNIDGNACFDFRLKENGDVVLLEINPRLNASLPFVRQAGVNMLYLRCKNLLGDYSDVNQPFHVKYGLKMRKYYESKYYL